MPMLLVKNRSFWPKMAQKWPIWAQIDLFLMENPLKTEKTSKNAKKRSKKGKKAQEVGRFWPLFLYFFFSATPGLFGSRLRRDSWKMRVIFTRNPGTFWNFSDLISNIMPKEWVKKMTPVPEPFSDPPILDPLLGPINRSRTPGKGFRIGGPPNPGFHFFGGVPKTGFFRRSRTPGKKIPIFPVSY